MGIITVVGGGNSAHTLIPLLSKAGHTVNLLTRKPEKWCHEVKMEYILPNGEAKDTILGSISKKSANPIDVIPDAEYIILCLPVSSYRSVLHKIGSYINNSKKVFVGTIFGQGGFNWMVNEIKMKYELTNIVTFAVGLIPWITRTAEYGKVGMNYGVKDVNIATVSPKEEFNFLNENIFNDLCFSHFSKGAFVQADNFISLTMSVDNQIIHQSRLYGLYLKSGGSWDKYEDVPYFYRDYDDTSASLLEELDGEYSKIRNGIIKKFPKRNYKYMLSYLELERLSNGSTNSNIKASFISSKTLGQIGTPVVKDESDRWVINADHRFFYDDVFYGICIAKWFAQKLEVETPILDKILYWAQNILGDKIIKDGKLEKVDCINFKYGTPDVYGYTQLEDVID